MHQLLRRQLLRHFGSTDNIPLACKDFFEIVSRTYEEKERENKLIERTLEISSRELTEVNDRLRSENKRIEDQVTSRTEQLFVERAKLNHVVENMDTGAILLDAKGTVLFTNKRAREILDYKGIVVSDVVKEKLLEKFNNNDISVYLVRSLAGETLVIPELDASGRIYEITFQHLSDKGQENKKSNISFGVLIWVTDITEEKLLERSKSELIAVASHQLRTPLTVTKGNTEMLLDEIFGTLNKDQKELIQQTHESNERLIELVNQMLDITQIDDARNSFKKEKVCIGDVVSAIAKDMGSYAAEKGCPLEYRPLDDGKRACVLGDYDRLYQVFQNLVENAIRYRNVEHEGTTPIKISVIMHEETIEVAIADQGIGIPDQEQKRIFQRFYRASNAIHATSTGTGLGLYAVKSVVEKMDGTVRFESKEGEGTTFFITLPEVTART